MKKLIILLITAAFSMLAQAAPKAGDPCEKNEANDHAVSKNGELVTCVVGDGDWKVLAAAPNMKRARRVEFLSVTTEAENIVRMKALLTYPDGAKAKCEYVAHWSMVKIGNRDGIQYIPDSESCKPNN